MRMNKFQPSMTVLFLQESAEFFCEYDHSFTLNNFCWLFLFDAISSTYFVKNLVCLNKSISMNLVFWFARWKTCLKDSSRDKKIISSNIGFNTNTNRLTDLTDTPLVEHSLIQHWLINSNYFIIQPMCKSFCIAGEQMKQTDEPKRLYLVCSLLKNAVRKSHG